MKCMEGEGRIVLMQIHRHVNERMFLETVLFLLIDTLNKISST